MCRGISILRSRIRQELFEEYELARLVHRRSETTEEELWFDFADRSKTVLLPILYAGQLVIREWGNRGGKGKLPKTGWCQQESLAAGKWRWLNPEPVEIPANFGLEKGIWFQVTEGMKGILVRDETRHEHVYMMTEAASHYYEVMTRHNRMPVLIGQTI
jgi:hypothetical protein